MSSPKQLALAELLTDQGHVQLSPRIDLARWYYEDSGIVVHSVISWYAGSLLAPRMGLLSTKSKFINPVSQTGEFRTLTKVRFWNSQVGRTSLWRVSGSISVLAMRQSWANGQSFAGIAKFLQDQTVGKPLVDSLWSTSGTAIDWVPRGRRHEHMLYMICVWWEPLQLRWACTMFIPFRCWLNVQSGYHKPFLVILWDCWWLCEWYHRAKRREYSKPVSFIPDVKSI